MEQQRSAGPLEAALSNSTSTTEEKRKRCWWRTGIKCVILDKLEISVAAVILK